jgi:hypothetical protein
LKLPLEIRGLHGGIFQLAIEIFYLSFACFIGLLELCDLAIGFFQVTEEHLLFRGDVIKLIQHNALLSLKSLHYLLEFVHAQLKHFHS